MIAGGVENTRLPLPGGGSFLERLVFGHRLWVIVCCAVLTLALAYSARQLTLNAAFSSRIPLQHRFIKNFLQHREDLSSQGNRLKIVVATAGSILDARYLDTLRAINDEVFLLPGVDRPYMKSLWTPSVRWLAVTEQGFAGGPVMPDHFDGGPKATAELLSNIQRSGEIGGLVAQDFHSSLLIVPLLERDATTGVDLDYGELGRRLDAIRDKYQHAGMEIHIGGFAKVMGDLIGGLRQILWFFALSVLIATAAVYWFTRCLRSTALVVTCSLVAVIWQVGLLPLLGYGLDPYSILVPFLIFAIGMSHGAQKMNGVMQDVGRGLASLEAARMTFRRLFIAGLTALVCDAVGFAVLLVIGIEAIQNLALIASLGVAILVITNLILLPILLSYVGVDRRAAARTVQQNAAEVTRLWTFLQAFTRPAWAAGVLSVACLIAALSWWGGNGLKVGDLEPGAPELRKTSTYNIDDAYLTGHYGASSDQLVVMVTSPAGQCADYDTLAAIDRLEWELQTLPGVETTMSGADLARRMIPAFNEGNLKWAEVLPNAGTLHYLIPNAPREIFNHTCDLTPMTINLSDHKADTLDRVVQHVQQYAAAHPGDVQFLLAAGNAGIEAATNAVVAQSSATMLLYVYAAVVVLSLVTFRSWRAVLVAVIPLLLTSLAAQALMVMLGIGLKVATLPVTALGVGIGVDYALYTLSVTLAAMRAGATLAEAYLAALQFTGRVVMLTGFTLAAAVMTWAFSPIKFQADMGILLSFMFVVNMLGALILLPALACFLLQPLPRRAGHVPVKPALAPHNTVRF